MIGNVVGVGLRVKEVAAPQVGPALAQGHQAPQAAHVAGGEAQPRVPAAQQGGQEVQGVVVAAQDHQGAVDVLRGDQQFRGHRPVLLQPLAQGRHHQEAVGPDQGGDGARAPGQGRGDDLVSHPAQGHPDELGEPGFGRQILGRIHGRVGRGARRLPGQPGNQGGGELLEGEHRGDRVAGVADHRLAGHHPQEGGFAGHHGHSVHQHLPQGGHGLVGVILGARGGAGVDEHHVRGGHRLL